MDDITEEHYLIGEKNGISRKNVRQRYWSYGWEIEKAITEPTTVNQSDWLQWKQIALSNGVNNSCFHGRIKKGLTSEQAATIPVQSKGGNMRIKKWEELK